LARALAPGRVERVQTTPNGSMTVTTETAENRPQGAPPPQPRRLERSRQDRVLAGVCGGLARYLGVDPVLVRIVVVAAMVFGGFGAVAYLAAWLLVPEEGAERPLLGGARQRQSVQIAAIVLLALAAVSAFGIWTDAGFVVGGWPFLLLMAGAAVIWFVVERDRPGSTDQAPGAAAAAEGDETTVAAGEPAVAAPAPAPRRGSFAVTAIAAGGVCLLVGAFGALDAAGAVDLGWGGLVAVAIVATGVALVASSFFGGARALIPLGIVLALLLGGTAAAGVSFNGGVGEREYRVRDGDELRGRYALGVGHLMLDLRGIELAQGTTRVSADLDVGMLEIVAPDGRFLDDTDVRAGDGGRGTGGFDVRRTIVVGDGARRLEIDAHVGVGAIVMSRRPGNDGDWERSSSDPLPRTAPFAGVLR
jgi:phage shock protein PspC (stress-responsive transcriptional regulator)